MDFKYAFKDMNDNMAKAVGKSLGISTKKSYEVCNHIRKMPLNKAKKFLQRVVEKKSAVEMKRNNQNTPHRKGMAAGKYPVKAAKEILAILESAESNAQNKGLSKDLIIRHISAHKASQPWHQGTKKRSRMKRTHIQVVLEEKKQAKETKNY